MILRRISCCLLAVCLLTSCGGTSAPSESTAENTNSGLKWYELTDYADVDFDSLHLGFMNAEGKELHWPRLPIGDPDTDHPAGDMEYFHSLELPVEGGDCPHTTSFTVPRSDWFRVLTRTPSYGSVSAFGVSFVEDGAYLNNLRVEGDFEGTITLRQDGGVELEGYNNGIVVTFSKAKNKDDSEYLFYEWRGDTDITQAFA